MRSLPLTLCALVASAVSAVAAPDMTERLDAVVTEAVSAQRIVGAVVLVAQDGKVVYHRAAGMADREAGVPMREDTVFRLASLTKPIASVAALSLVAQSKLSLDAPVTRY